MNYLLIIISIVLAALRAFGIKSEIYQAAAHLFVGMLFGWVACRRYLAPFIWPRSKGEDSCTLYSWLAFALVVTEVICFIWKH